MVRRKCVLWAGCWPAVSSVHALTLIEVHAQSSLQRGVPYVHGSPSSLISTTWAKGMVVHFKNVVLCVHARSVVLLCWLKGNLNTICTLARHAVTHRAQTFPMCNLHSYTPQKGVPPMPHPLAPHSTMPQVHVCQLIAWEIHTFPNHTNVVENQFHVQKEGYFLMLWDRPDMEWDLGLRVTSTFVHALGGYTLTIHSYACTNMLMTLYYTLYTSNIGVHTYIHTYTSCVWSFVCTFKCDVYNLHAVWSTLLFICEWQVLIILQ